MLKYSNCALECTWSHKSSQLNMCSWCLNMSNRGFDIPSFMAPERQNRDVVVMFHHTSSLSYRDTDVVMLHYFCSCMSNNIML